MEVAIFAIGFWLGGVFVAAVVMAHSEGLRSGSFERRMQRPEGRGRPGPYTAVGTVRDDSSAGEPAKIRVAR